MNEKRAWQQRVGDALAAQHLTVQFGLLGSGNMAVVERLEVRGVRYVAARSETVAVNMADGWARVTGRPGLCSVTAGPGMTAALTGLVTAQRANTPMVLLAAETHRSDGNYPAPFDRIQALDQLRTLEGMDIPAVRLGRDAPQDDIDAAFDLAADVRSPVVVISAKAKPHLGASERNDAWHRAAAHAAALATDLPPDALPEEAVHAVLRSNQVLLLAGRGARGCRTELLALGRQVGAKVGTTLAAAGLFAEAPGQIGIVGGFSRPPAKEWLRSVDCVLSFGASLNEFTLDRGRLFRPDATIVQCDHDARARHPWVDQAGFFLHGPSRQAVERLTSALRNAAAGGSTDQGREATEASPSPSANTPDNGSEAESPRVADGDGLNPIAVSTALDAALPRSRRLVCDVGHFALFPPAHVRVTAHPGLLFMHEFGAVGTGLGAAIGSAIAAEEASDEVTTVLVIGDGGLQMTLGDLASTDQVNSPLLILCFNDQGYGAEYHQLTTLGLPTEISAIPNPGFASVATSFGIPARTVSSLQDLRQALNDFRTSTGPMLVDVSIDRSVKSPLLGPPAPSQCHHPATSTTINAAARRPGTS